MAHSYDWAVNKTKLAQSVKALEDKKKLDSKVEVSEDSIKEEYVKRGGLLRESAKEAAPQSLADLSVAKLKKLAKDNEVDISEASDKEAIIAALEAANVSL